MQGITVDEYQHRIDALQSSVAHADLNLFIVSAFDSIYYLTGVGFEPFERPFFLLVWPDRSPVLLVPKLEQEHMKRAHNIPHENIQTYWDYPATSSRGWPDRLRELIGRSRQVGVEPTLPQEISQELRDFSLQVEPLVERTRSIKSNNEIGLIRRAARYADLSIEPLRKHRKHKVVTSKLDLALWSGMNPALGAT
jgi:Xaa-Pro aminopeptidase